MEAGNNTNHCMQGKRLGQKMIPDLQSGRSGLRIHDKSAISDRFHDVSSTETTSDSNRPLVTVCYVWVALAPERNGAGGTVR